MISWILGKGKISIEFVGQFEKEYWVKNICKLSYFLGLNVERENESFKLDLKVNILNNIELI